MAELRMHVLDVGQGASVVLDFGDHKYGIIDCGGSHGGQEAPIVRFFKQTIARDPLTRILFLLISHLDVDHVKAIGGLIEDREIEGRIEKLYCNQIAYRKLWLAAKAAIKPGSGIALNRSNRGAMAALRYLGDLIVHRLDVEPDFHAELVAPEGSNKARYPVQLVIDALPENFECHLWAPSQYLRDLGLENMDTNDLFRALFSGAEIEDWNAASIVITLTFSGRRVLLAGDATRRTWAEILKRAGTEWVGADVVLGWHHGGRLGSESGVNYDSVVWKHVLTRDTKIVCISCGSHNRYGHPHPDTITSIHGCGGQVFCTEQKSQRVDPSVALVQDDQTTTLLRSRSKSPLWIEDEEICCGDIVVEIKPEGAPVVQCSTGECARRGIRDGCCERGALVQVAGAP